MVAIIQNERGFKQPFFYHWVKGDNNTHKNELGYFTLGLLTSILFFTNAPGRINFVLIHSLSDNSLFTSIIKRINKPKITPKNIEMYNIFSGKYSSVPTII